MMSSSMTFILYLSVFAISARLIYLSSKIQAKQSRGILTALALTPPALLAAFRVDIGTDYNSYVNIIEALSSMGMVEYVTQGYHGIEPANYLIARVSNLAPDNSVLYFFVMSFITSLFTILAIKKIDLKFASVAFFALMMIIFPTSLNGVRQMAAVAISFYGIAILLKDKHYKKYLGYILIASLFHVSAAIMLPFAILPMILKPHDSLLKIFKIFLIAISAVATAVIVFILLGEHIPFIEKYAANNSTALSGNNRLIYLQATVVAVLAIAYTKYPTLGPYYSYFLLLSLIEVLMLGLGFWSEYLKRLHLYFLPYGIVLISMLASFPSKARLRRALTTLYVGYIMVLFSIMFFILGHSDVVPYKVEPQTNQYIDTK